MPETTETYNGWTNYATWGVALVLDNDETTYNEVRETARAYRDGADLHDNVTAGIWTAEEAVRYELADWIKDYTERLCDDTHLRVPGRSLMASQVIQAGLAEVNWDEIARNVLSE